MTNVLLLGPSAAKPEDVEQAPLPSAAPGMCEYCLFPIQDYRPRTQVESEYLRNALLITAPTLDPVICDRCFNRALQGFGATAEAHQVTNLLLRCA